MKQVNLTDFDFAQPYVARSHKTSQALSDCMVTIGVKGKTRKADNHTFLLSAFFKKTNANYKSLIVGKNKFNKRGEASTVVFFDSGLPQSASIGHNEKGGIWYASSKANIVNLLTSFGVNIPDVPGTSIRFHFNLEPVQGMPKVYVVIPMILERIDALGATSRIDMEKIRVRQTDNREANIMS